MDVPESFKQELKRIFEIAANKGEWIYYGGKIVISTEKPKPGKRQVVRGTVIRETITEI